MLHCAFVEHARSAAGDKISERDVSHLSMLLRSQAAGDDRNGDMEANAQSDMSDNKPDTHDSAIRRITFVDRTATVKKLGAATVAPTGAAAGNCGGSTVDRAFKFSRTDKEHKALGVAASGTR